MTLIGENFEELETMQPYQLTADRHDVNKTHLNHV